MQYLVIVEKGDKGYEAHVPDLPNCIAAAATREEVLDLIREGIEFHTEGLREQGDTVPLPSSVAEVVAMSAA